GASCGAWIGSDDRDHWRRFWRTAGGSAYRRYAGGSGLDAGVGGACWSGRSACTGAGDGSTGAVPAGGAARRQSLQSTGHRAGNSVTAPRSRSRNYRTILTVALPISRTTPPLVRTRTWITCFPGGKTPALASYSQPDLRLSVAFGYTAFTSGRCM